MRKMKTVLFWLLLFTGIQNLRAEVYFIPGWYSQWINYRKHQAALTELFPGETVHICKWDSNRFWGNAKRAAGKYVMEFSGKLLAGETGDVTLIGHSLGGRIVLDCIAQIAAKRQQVRQIILLGTAGTITETDLQNCRQVSRLPVINIFCIDDNMLKLFYSKEKVMPLGLCGLPQPEKHFRQYRLPVPEHDIKMFDIKILSRKNMEFFRETSAHLAWKYIRMLSPVFKQQVKESYIDLAALEKIASLDSVKNDFLPGYVTVDECAGWKLASRRFRRRYRISSPAGKFFYYDSESIARRNFTDISSIMKSVENE